MLWKSMDISRCEYSFLIEGMGLEDGDFSPVAHLVTDVETVQMMRAAEQGEFIIVTNIHLILPPTKREQGSYAMELLSEIRIQAGTEENPVYEFVTGTGHIYTSARA